ncbi:ABC transporter substrate-binding protein [Xylanibacillus composti]|uniref:Extracellular solute-binding protein n=1 Tax=Xylanibacillus composti TaxID=1572762 RepID=A0A8J4H1H9_9BACL|nr:extracellular solute-binding protein [Xylanibacillus composti]GIQ69212.1 hypothetical protein XYCOK13_20360 [Xylanibacillus composti]
MRLWFQGIIAGLLMLLAGCGGISPGHEQAVPKPGHGDLPSQATLHATEASDKLEIWSYYDLGERNRAKIRELLPDLDISFQVASYYQAIDLYKKALTRDEVPDIFILETAWLGSFNDSLAFEDLAASPYEAESLLEPYPESILAPFRTLDGAGLIALPFDMNPAVTYYRYDVMQEAGLPAEPEALARFMEEPDNWLHIAQTLKQRNQWSIAWGSDPLDIFSKNTSFFDSELSFAHNNEQIARAIELGRAIENQKLASMSNIFDKNNNSIQSEDTVMFHTGYWYRYMLEELAPEQSGNWRITRLPFNAYGWSGSSAVAIAAKSANKDAAWQAAEWLATGYSRYIEELLHADAGSPNAYFGGQKLEPLVRELILRMPAYTFTPLDEKANRIWREVWTEEKDDSSLTAQEVASLMEQRVMEELAPQIEVLQHYLQESRKAN